MGDCGELPSLTETGSFDYFAVGMDCCGCPNGEFRCGEWDNPLTHGGLRVLDDHKLLKYKLAVKQWESVWGQTAKQPLFFEWTLRPARESAGMGSHANAMGIMAIAAFLCVQIFIGFGMDSWRRKYQLEYG